MTKNNDKTTITRRTIVGLLVAAATLATLASAGAALGSRSSRPPSDLTPAQTKEIREATKAYRNVEAALADGYLPTDECAALPDVGGMGFHYVSPANMADGTIDPTRPEVLLYVLNDDDELKLAGVEYFAVDQDQDLATDDDRPNLHGHPFDGPMPGHDPQMPVHYDLHVWLYVKNPAGALAPWNPKVSCPVSGADHHDNQYD